MLYQAGENVPGVRLICANILEQPGDVPGDMDIVTAFRFLLLSEPQLHRACINALVQKLRSSDSIMVLNTHGNPRSFRALASLRNRLLKRDQDPLPSFSLRQLHELAQTCGLRIVGAAGCGFIPPFLAKRLPRSIYQAAERILAPSSGDSVRTSWWCLSEYDRTQKFLLHHFGPIVF